MSLDERQSKFIGYLRYLAREGEEDRGALAELRSGLGKEDGEMARVHRHVAPYLADKPYHDHWYYLIATLFGAFPKHRSDRSLATAFGKLRAKSGSMEARFVALLNAHPDDLDDHLRYAVRLLQSSELSFNWYRLFDDLLQWDAQDHPVQLDWARDFWRDSGDQRQADDSQADKTEEEDSGDDDE